MRPNRVLRVGRVLGGSSIVTSSLCLAHLSLTCVCIHVYVCIYVYMYVCTCTYCKVDVYACMCTHFI